MKSNLLERLLPFPWYQRRILHVMQTAQIAQQRPRCSVKAAAACVSRPLNVHDRRLLRNASVSLYRGPARGDVAVLAAAEQEQELTQSEREDRVIARLATLSSSCVRSADSWRGYRPVA